MRTINLSESFQQSSRRSVMKLKAGLLIAALMLVVAGCSDGGSGAEARDEMAPVSATLEVRVVNVLDEPIGGAIVTVNSNGLQHQATTPASGNVSFAGLRSGPTTMSISADGFESESMLLELERGSQEWGFTLSSIGSWAIGRAIVLGTETVALADDGSHMTFSVDLAVIAGENSEPLQTLTEADFRIYIIDCGWGGSRDCASDAAANAAAGSGIYSSDGVARAFGLQPTWGRHPYVVGVLVERSGDGSEWDVKGPALGSFFTTLSGNDAVGLASVQVENDETTLKVLGPFTSDGNVYLGTIARLGTPANHRPPLMQTSLLESIRWTAAAVANEFPEREATLLVLSNPAFSVAEIDEAVTFAQQSGVHISTVTNAYGGYGLPEMAVRTGGFVAQIDDIRQFGMTFSTMDQLLAGTLPFYRMQFQLTGVAGTFVPGGNVKVNLQIDVPTSVVNRGVLAQFDFAIPR